jgi:probable rRNA maturation factor
MTLCFRNRQQGCAMDLRLLRRVLRYAIDHYFATNEVELCFHFVEGKEMAATNERYLGHVGATDVITFNHAEKSSVLHGEIFICPDVAVTQAKEFRTSWQEEIVRYAVHGLLHLEGHDDRAAAPRRKMKQKEDSIMAELSKHFALARLQRTRAR